ncbi:helix-turn-helix domain-containing protein [Hymenobacter sp. IS2118]|uniref:helix-turn-helix domain-containing protein n=1 Tax=Hymenobacter sp. IS2118 TaxID=1505605 RepID=UPI0006894F14|nr:AraC family transcriptional regulator [Hymenobacter sp. IS2118]
MFVHLDLVVVFQLFCIVQGLTTGVYLLVARPRRAGSRWLGLLLLGLTLQVVDYFLSQSGVYYRHRWLYFTPLFFSWSFGPLLLAYVREVYGSARRLSWRHFVPVAGQALFYGIISLQSFNAKTWFWLNVHKPMTRYVEHYGAIVSVLSYLFVALRVVGRHERRPRWLWAVLLGLGVFYGAAALDPLVNAAYLPAGAPKFYLTTVALPVLAYAVALGSWLSRGVTRPAPAPEPASTTPTTDSAPASASLPAQRPAGSPGPVVDPDHLARVVQALDEEQLYRDPDLTLDSLARHVGLSANVVSQTINAGLQQSFHDVVNGYRLAEVKQRLLGPDARRLTVLALALEAGFNSKTTFNRVFKEKTGLTPKEYQKKSQPTRWDDSVPSPG